MGSKESFAFSSLGGKSLEGWLLCGRQVRYDVDDHKFLVFEPVPISTTGQSLYRDYSFLLNMKSTHIMTFDELWEIRECVKE